MAMPKLPIEGGCRCGRVRFRLTEQPWLEAACHCRGCQRMTASAFSTTLVVPEGGFAVIAGEPVIGGLHGDVADHHHCDWCKSWVFTRPRAAMGFVNVRATLLDDPYWFAPWLETQTAEKLPWAVTGAERSFERFPGHGGIPGPDRRLPDGADDRLIRAYPGFPVSRPRADADIPSRCRRCRSSASGSRAGVRWDPRSRRRGHRPIG